MQEGEWLGRLVKLNVGTGERKHVLAFLVVFRMVVDLAGPEVDSGFVFPPSA